MLSNRKAQSEQGSGGNFTTIDEFQIDDGDGSTGGVGTGKQFIKLPKHYEPSLFKGIY